MVKKDKKAEISPEETVENKQKELANILQELFKRSGKTKYRIVKDSGLQYNQLRGMLDGTLDFRSSSLMAFLKAVGASFQDIHLKP